MASYEIRNLESGDFQTLMDLEEAIFGGDGEPLLGPYYVRLCCEFFRESCFVAVVRGQVVGYLLSFVRGREAYCTTLAVVPEFQGTRVVFRLLQAFTKTIVAQADSCWFTVKPENEAARAVHALLGAENVTVREDFYGPGDRRIVSRIDRSIVERMRGRYERLGLLDRTVGEPSGSAPQHPGLTEARA